MLEMVYYLWGVTEVWQLHTYSLDVKWLLSLKLLIDFHSKEKKKQRFAIGL